MRLTLWAATAVASMIICAGAALAQIAASGSTSADYAAFPPDYDMPAGFDFSNGQVPSAADWDAGAARLLDFLETSQFSALRAHSWQVFAGITSPSGGGYSIWESWYSGDAVYAGPNGARPQTLSDRRASIHSARQLGLLSPGGPEAAPGQSVAAAVLFNQPIRDHIWANKLYLPDTLAKLNAGFDAAKTPLALRSIPQFPQNAIALKTIWSVVSSDGLTVLPVWDGELEQPAVAVSPPYPSDVWPRCVAVSPDPSYPDPTAQVTCNARPLAAKVVGLDAFYHFRIEEAELQAVIAAIGEGPKDGTPAQIKVGDYAILLGMHFTTREVPNWVWATAWWHDEPNRAPYGSDRPGNVDGVWVNYLMKDGYSREVPLANDDGPHTVWNPYIEGKYPDGMRSNCMSCHIRAVYPRLDPVISGFDLCGALPVVRGDASLDVDDPALNSRVRLEFLWSILLESRLPGGDPCK